MNLILFFALLGVTIFSGIKGFPNNHYNPYDDYGDEYYYDDSEMMSFVPTQKPVYPRNKPSVPTQKPVYPRNKPSVPTQKPVYPRNKPSVPTQKPVYPRNKPSVPTQKPVYPRNKPSVPTQKPVYPGNKPSVPTQKPVQSVNKNHWFEEIFMNEKPYIPLWLISPFYYFQQTYLSVFFRLLKELLRQ
ncbi:unnamed protein product [Heterobilharzia americana]|nr:unnamed protein product [Heterobilharzia americana]